MAAGDANFLAALRLPHNVVIQVDAWRNGSRIATALPVEGGEVTVDSGSRVRRQLRLTLAPEPGMWDLLSPIGVELRPSRGLRYPNGTVETVPLGIFPIDVQRMGYSPAGRLELTAPDPWAQVQRRRFEKPTAALSVIKSALTGDPAYVRDEIAQLVTGAVPGSTSLVTASSLALMRRVVWERDRDEAIASLCASIGAEAFFDAAGKVIVRDQPTLADRPVWTVDASATGVLLNADRERNRQRTYNIVVAAGEVVDGRAPFAPQVVEDTDPASPTRVSGAFGRVPFFYTSPLLTTTAQAQTAAKAILARVRGLAAQLTLEAIVNPTLEAGHVINVLLPPEVRGRKRPVEKHLIDAVTIPLSIDGTQSITTRSTRPDDTTE